MRKNVFMVLLFTLVTIVGCKDVEKSGKVPDKLLINHLGYHSDYEKKVVLQSDSKRVSGKFYVVDEKGNAIFESTFEKGGKIDNWHTGNAYSGYFSVVKGPGKYQVITSFDGDTVKSEFFTINKTALSKQCLPLLVDGFKHERCAPPYDTKDMHMSFFGSRTDTVDVHGGWYDASGDRGKYFSHLCYSNYMCPQQTPIVVWNMLESFELLNKKGSNKDSTLLNSILEEAAYGADFLARMYDKEGYFYTNIFANWSWESQKREICAYEGSDGKKTDEYRAAFREGGGIAVASLARAGKLGLSKDFNGKKYLQIAKLGYSTLLEKSLVYADDGEEDIIDVYCALLASIELYAATDKIYYLEQAQGWTSKLASYQRDDENYKAWWSANMEGSRPYFHAVEAGLPLIALYRYLQFEKDMKLRDVAITAIKKSVKFELGITKEVNNPFGYPRQYVKAVDSEMYASFFIPHNNETGYWWQGENARLASLASAFSLVQNYLDEKQKLQAKAYTVNQINWILGLNPYDTGMFEGLGRNNPDYKEGASSLNYVGGICNGITAGFDDESDIAFMPLPQNNDPAQKWRWSEQWIPHAAWFMLAVSAIEN